MKFWLDSCSFELLPLDPSSSLRHQKAQEMYENYFLNVTKACSDLELDVDTVHEIYKILKIKTIHQHETVTEKDETVLRSAFVIATGHVFSDLKYMHMPGYLSSTLYQSLLPSQATTTPEFIQAKNNFEMTILTQKIPVSFIFNKPHMQHFLISYIARRKDGRKWCVVVHTCAPPNSSL